MLKKIRQHPIQKHLSDLLRGDVRLSCTRKLMCKHFNFKTDLCIPNIDQNCFKSSKAINMWFKMLYYTQTAHKCRIVTLKSLGKFSSETN